MARNAADAADAARPKGENFSASPTPKSPFAYGDKPDSARSAACRITLSDIVAHLVDAEKFS
jgi:hypothetical protein